MLVKESGEKGKEGMTLLVHSREIRTDETSGLSARPTAKAAGDFLLNFDHANIAFDQIIVEGDSKIIDKSQNLSALPIETFSEITRFALLGAPALAFGPALRRRLGNRQGLCNQLLIVVVNLSTQRWRQGGCALRFGRIDLRFDGQQELFELAGPGLSKLLMQSG